MASVTSSLVWKRVGPAVVMASASTTWRSYGSETKCEEAPKKKQTPEEFREGHKRAMEMMESMYKTHDCGKQIKEYHQCIYDECDKEHRVYVKKCVPIAQQVRACMEAYNIEYRKGCIAKYGEEKVLSFEKEFGVDPETRERQKQEQREERLRFDKEMIEKYGKEKFMKAQKALGRFGVDEDKNIEETAEVNDTESNDIAPAPEKKKKKKAWYRFGF